MMKHPESIDHLRFVQPPVTWLISVKNSMPYLTEALGSIAAQTYRNHSVLIWDDCSTDGSLEELQRWIPSRLPGKIFTGRTALHGASLAFLVEQADTEFCARMDGDDVCLPQRLEKQVAFLQEHAEVGLVGAFNEVFVENSDVRYRESRPTGDADIRWATKWSSQFCHPTVVFRRQAVLDAGNYPGDIRWEEGPLFMRMTRITEMRNIPECLLRYRRHPGNGTFGETDYISIEREVALHSGKHVFPAFPSQGEFFAFWQATHPKLFGKQLPVQWKFKKILKQMAIRAAREAGKPDDYFQNTRLYQDQQYNLRRCWMLNRGLGPLIQLRQRLAWR